VPPASAGVDPPSPQSRKKGRASVLALAAPSDTGNWPKTA
jgi:hypothetical protein